jgi:hypothetical protein
VAKHTVYIPDELLERAKALAPRGEVVVSQLVQRGLHCLLGTGQPSYAAPPDDVNELLTPAREALVALAKDEYQQGYRAAAARLPALPWYVLEHISDADFNVRQWANGLQRALGHEAAAGDMDTPEWLWPMAEDLGRDIDPIGYDQTSFRRSQPWLEGYSAAIRDVWQSLRDSEMPTESEEAND